MSTLALVTLGIAQAQAEEVSAKKIQIKDNADSSKRQIQVQSADAQVEFSEAIAPDADGASVHVYSATDNFCALLPSGPEWQSTGSLWKYNNKTTKRSAQIGDGKLKIKIKSGVTYTLADNGTQGTVNVQVQFGSGTRYCLRCPGNTKDDTKMFLGKSCGAANCDAEPPGCDPFSTTTTSTSTTVTTSTTTTTAPLPGSILKLVLPKSTGLFNYMGTGIANADARCNTEFAGTHACTIANLQAAQAAGDLDHIKDINNLTVTSFWAIDATHANNTQCFDATGLSNMQRWDYQTAHTGTGGEAMALNNAAGTLGPVTGGLICLAMKWVGCCL